MTWHRSLAALVAVRLAFPLLALAASGHKLPLLPRYDYGPLRGDAPAYLATARELLAAWRRLGPFAPLLGCAVVAGSITAVVLWRRRPELRPWVLAGSGLVVSLVVIALISEIGRSPAGAVGWPLLWSVPLAPLRALHLIGADSAFAAALVLSLAAHAVAVIAIAHAGLAASGRRGVGLLAAGLYAFWPVLSGLLAGGSAARNDTWAVETGLAGFSEPLSTALVALATALVLRGDPVRLAGGGLALGAAALVRPTNALIALAALVFVACVHRSGALRFAAAALAPLPAAVAFQARDTAYEVSELAGGHFGTGFIASGWLDSSLWSPRTVVVLLPLAILGGYALRRAPALLLGASVLLTAAFYSFFQPLAEHPRYLFSALPALLVLVAAGLARVAAVRSS